MITASPMRWETFGDSDGEGDGDGEGDADALLLEAVMFAETVGPGAADDRPGEQPASPAASGAPRPIATSRRGHRRTSPAIPVTDLSSTRA
jgi:hypothetical protein